MGISTGVGLLASGGLGLIGSGLSANAQSSAANTQAQAALQAAQIQAQSQAAALNFAERQAAQNLATQNAMNKGSYDQWQAQQQRLSDFGQSQFGLQPRQIPSYVPIPTSYGAYGGLYNLPDPSATPTAGTPGAAAPSLMAGTPAAPASGGNSYLQYLQNQMAQQQFG